MFSGSFRTILHEIESFLEIWEIWLGLIIFPNFCLFERDLDLTATFLTLGYIFSSLWLWILLVLPTHQSVRVTLSIDFERKYCDALDYTYEMVIYL